MYIYICFFSSCSRCQCVWLLTRCRHTTRVRRIVAAPYLGGIRPGIKTRYTQIHVVVAHCVHIVAYMSFVLFKYSGVRGEIYNAREKEKRKKIIKKTRRKWNFYTVYVREENWWHANQENNTVSLVVNTGVIIIETQVVRTTTEVYKVYHCCYTSVRTESVENKSRMKPIWNTFHFKRIWTRINSYRIKWIGGGN